MMISISNVNETFFLCFCHLFWERSEIDFEYVVVPLPLKKNVTGSIILNMERKGQKSNLKSIREIFAHLIATLSIFCSMTKININNISKYVISACASACVCAGNIWHVFASICLFHSTCFFCSVSLFYWICCCLFVYDRFFLSSRVFFFMWHATNHLMNFAWYDAIVECMNKHNITPYSHVAAVKVCRKRQEETYERAKIMFLHNLKFKLKTFLISLIFALPMLFRRAWTLICTYTQTQLTYAHLKW